MPRSVARWLVFGTVMIVTIVLSGRAPTTAVQAGITAPQRTGVALLASGDEIAEVQKPRGRITRAPVVDQPPPELPRRRDGAPTYRTTRRRRSTRRTSGPRPWTRPPIPQRRSTPRATSSRVRPSSRRPQAIRAAWPNPALPRRAMGSS